MRDLPRSDPDRVRRCASLGLRSPLLAALLFIVLSSSSRRAHACAGRRSLHAERPLPEFPLERGDLHRRALEPARAPGADRHRRSRIRAIGTCRSRSRSPGCTLVNPIGNCPAARVSSPGTGPRSVRYEPWRCVVGTTYPAYVGHTCNVKVRALDFGSAGAPAQFDLTLRSTTVVPTSTISSTITTNPVQTLTVSPSKDTTIYQANTSASNGLRRVILGRRRNGGERAPMRCSTSTWPRAIPRARSSSMPGSSSTS